MKKSLLISMLCVISVGTSLNLASPTARAADTESNGGALKDDDNTQEDNSASSGTSVEQLNKAHAFLQQFQNLGTDPAKGAERKKLLVRARKAIWQVAPDEAVYHGTRKEASLDILAALKELRQDTPDEKVIADHVRRADTELRSAISAGAKTAVNP